MHIRVLLVPRLNTKYVQMLQPRNILTRSVASIDDTDRANNGYRDVVLCDLDAATRIGDPRPAGLKMSEGYLPPEQARNIQVR